MADPTPDLGSQDFAALDFASVTPAEFSALVKKTSRAQMAELMRGELRARVLAEIFGRMERQFNPEGAGSLKALIRWEITGDPVVVYETSIADGACAVTPGRSDAEPRVTLTMADPEFLKLVSGNGSPVTMFMTRKLKVAGDVGLASALTRIFDIPKS
ncbi:SCP2 sterol-binding domain-containing protein [Streptomyces sp. RFCAC02]|uniref:SCP2 sterol-binding domain-containing protein n=1 Tax=Streptomyces sp. RFCAC02 TaxID=2499143 RepID=UPI00101F9E77|nr:SCP2 sterol-binding domain-containing protein [Streptomyces sp. RFCAC02]